MSLNMSKSKVMHCRPKGVNRCMRNLYLGNDVVDYCEKYKYLGVLFTEHLDFTEHDNILTAAGSRALGAVIAKYKTLENMGYETFTKCVETAVYPVVDYGAEVWGGLKNANTDNVQLKAIRCFLGVHQFAPISGILGDMGWLPSEYRRKICMLRYWNRLIVMKDERITKKVFNTDYENSGLWCKHIQSILAELGLSEVYVDKVVVNIVYCKHKMYKLYNEKWKELVSLKPKLDTYVKLKSTFDVEYYVTLKLNKQQRSILAQLRLGILPLYIETGRFINVKRENRICTLCEENEVEDELHFLFKCTLYNDIRNQFLSNYTMVNTYSRADQFKYLCENLAGPLP